MPQEITGRNISDVIDRLLAEIPTEEATLRNRLEKIKRDSFFAAPEDRRRFWAMAAHAMSTRVDEIVTEKTPPWCGKTWRIFQGEKEGVGKGAGE